MGEVATKGSISVEGKVPVHFLVPSSTVDIALFNLNDWEGVSRQIIFSCSAQAGLIRFSQDAIRTICGNLVQHCAGHTQTIAHQWKQSPWNLEKTYPIAELPVLHLHVQGFFSAIKTHLDLLAKLLSSEGIVNSVVHGFHKDKKKVGGAVLNMLRNNALKEKRVVAKIIDDLIVTETKEWIEDAVLIRDGLFLHPLDGIPQLMVRIDIMRTDKGLTVEYKAPEITKPEEIERFANGVVRFTKKFLDLIKKDSGIGSTDTQRAQILELTGES
ncbi:MAG: hypothetical protein HYU99_04590 [Deltaproteobacteria bacterium]|nr:hypothetical protein [Deltaproteobacteria bacterium]